MKVLLINGSPHAHGCTYTALSVVADELGKADGLVIGSPVYYAGPNGTLVSFLDRLFFSTSFDKRFKVGAAVVSARRMGTTATLDTLNKYFLHGEMPVASSRYWNDVHGNSPEEVMKDEEGLQTIPVPPLQAAAESMQPSLAAATPFHPS